MRLMQIELESERMFIRTSTQKMARAILSYYVKNKEHLAPWQDKSEDAFYTKSYQKKIIKAEKQNLLSGKSIDLYLIEKEEKKLVGKVSVFGVMQGNYSSCIIGYSLDADHVGKGYMNEALKTVEEFLFGQLNIHRIEINIIPRNTRSIHVAERLGYINEGEAARIIRVNGVWENHYRFAKINPDYFEY